jgi:hypothetical protein
MAPYGVELRDRPVSKPAVATAAPFPPSRLERLVNAVAASTKMPRE